MALADKYYSHVVWDPKEGDYYTTARADLELYRVVKIENGKIYTEYCSNVGVLSEWDLDGFTTKDFGPYRVHVADYIIKMYYGR